ncbi:MAG: folylpolyglutamate synthase/dihydrofolate synthase family protein [Myxococcales bacterium]
MTFEELKSLLFVRSNFGVKLGLERMHEACAALGNPERSAPVLHVAGTNGKGSTCAFAEASLRAAGFRTGLYTSPHLNHFCERIRVAGEPISEARAAELLDEIRARVPWALGDPGLTFFEIVTLMGFLAFRRNVDVMVVEVGLGGRLDATNVVQPLACAVASLGLEHTQYLGPTLAHVAAEKAGIFKRGAPAVSAGQPREAAVVLQKKAQDLDISLWRPGRDYRYESRDVRPFCYQGPRWAVRAGDLALKGHHQRTNAALASALLEAAAQAGLRVEPHHVEAGLRTARWPARLEQFGNVLVDGAHNPHAVGAVVRALPALLACRQAHAVFGVLHDKDAAAMLSLLAPVVTSLHYCAPDSPRATTPEALAALQPGEAYPSVREAVAGARRAAGSDGVVLCVGSLYLAAEVRSLLLGEARPAMPSERL